MQFTFITKNKSVKNKKNIYSDNQKKSTLHATDKKKTSSDITKNRHESKSATNVFIKKKIKNSL